MKQAVIQYVGKYTNGGNPGVCRRHPVFIYYVFFILTMKQVLLLFADEEIEAQKLFR